MCHPEMEKTEKMGLRERNADRRRGVAKGLDEDTEV